MQALELSQSERLVVEYLMAVRSLVGAGLATTRELSRALELEPAELRQILQRLEAQGAVACSTASADEFVKLVVPRSVRMSVPAPVV
jgi:DNA-binding MarR family transcriptional regulator